MTRPKPNKKEPCKATLKQRFKWLLEDLKGQRAQKAAEKLRDVWQDLLKHLTQTRKKWTWREVTQWSNDLALKLKKVIKAEKQLIKYMGIPEKNPDKKKLAAGTAKLQHGWKLYREAMQLYGASRKAIEKAEKIERYYENLVAKSGSPSGPFMIYHIAAYKGVYRSEKLRKKGDQKWHEALRYILEGEEEILTLKWKITKQILKKKYCIDLYWKYGSSHSQEQVLHRQAPKYLNDKQRETYKLQQTKRSKVIRSHLRRLRSPR
jgi:hypothetical protein